MKTKMINIYTAAELKEHCPEGFEKALENWRENVQTDPALVSEIVDSFKAVFKAAGLTLKDYSIGGRGTGCRVEFNEAAGELTGKRAFAWIENNLLDRLRIPWSGKGRWKNAKYGRDYRPGLIPPCPLTGVCFDDDLLDDLRDSIRGGLSIKEAFEGLADKAAKLIEEEIEAQCSEEYFLDHADANGYEYTENGKAA